MLIRCKICQREFPPELRKKLLGSHEQGLCPECLYLCRQQGKLGGPEKMILRILHEYLVRNNVADEKSFVRLNMPIPSEYSHFWTEDIVGFFLLRWYVVTYFVHGNRDQVVEFNKKLHSAFDPVSHDIQRDFFFDSNHLRFHVEKVVEGELSETKHGQFQVTVSF